MMRVVIVLIMTALVACTSVPREIDSDELYWNPRIISGNGCPDLAGKYQVPAKQISREFIPIPFAVDPISKNRSGRALQPSDYFDVTLVIMSVSGGLHFTGRTIEKEGEYRMYFDGKYFGCANGEVVRRQKPFLTKGAESGECRSVAYSESHWRLNSDGDLVVTEVDRERCYSQRGAYLPDSDQVRPTRIYKRIP